MGTMRKKKKKYMGAIVVNEIKDDKAKEKAKQRFAHLGKKQFEKK